MDKYLDGLVLDTLHNAKLSMDVRDLSGTATIRGIPLIKTISMGSRSIDVLFACLCMISVYPSECSWKVAYMLSFIRILYESRCIGLWDSGSDS